MSEREQAARRFADLTDRIYWPPQPASDPASGPGIGALSWCIAARAVPLRPGVMGEPCLWLPAPDAPLHEHLAFVGRIAEAVGAGAEFSAEVSAEFGGARVLFGDHAIALAPDLSHAALLAAISAVEAGYASEEGR